MSGGHRGEKERLTRPRKKPSFASKAKTDSTGGGDTQQAQTSRRIPEEWGETHSFWEDREKQHQGLIGNR